MPSHPIDFRIQADVFSTPELVAVFEEKARFKRWLAFEAALAAAQARLGVIPEEAAVEINDKATLEHLDLLALADSYKVSRNSLMPVVNGLRRACANGHGEFVHYGATTQDVLDTSQVLELKAVFAILFRDLRKLEDILIGLSRRYRETPMIGRTHGQQALPITLGLKTVVWQQEVRRHINRLLGLHPRVLVGQLSGAVGTMAALGPLANQVAADTLKSLGLGHTTVSWHTARDNIAEVGSFFALLAGTFEKIANEIFQLTKTEIFELSEPAPGKAMSSSTMPHKRNPVLCQRVSVLARHIRGLTHTIFDSMGHEHERDARCLWAEWLAVPQSCIYVGTALQYLLAITEGLKIREDRMLENLHLQKDKVVSEWLMFKLGSAIGKMRAQKKLSDIFARVDAAETTLEVALREDVELHSQLTVEDFAMLDHPEFYTGHAAAIVDAALEETLACRQNDPEELK
jgi:3-carboxy-cis,cis-muconate cycloisomerase